MQVRTEVVLSRVRHVIVALRLVGLAADLRSAARLVAILAGLGCRPQEVNLRPIPGQPIALRPRTVDVRVAANTVVGRHHVPPDGLRPRRILDVGANIGLTIAHYATSFPDAVIVGVELDAENAALARRNTASFGARCQVITAAVWSEDGSVAYDTAEAEWGYRIGAGDGDARAMTLDTVLRTVGWDSVDFLKLDIEGAEQVVFAQPAAWPARTACLQVETHLPYTVEDCLRDLTELGFRAERDHRHWAGVVARRA